MKIRNHILAAAMMVAVSLSANAQQIVNADSGFPAFQNPATNSIFQSTEFYFTSSNTNIPAHGHFEIAIGMAYQSGVNIGADFGVRGYKELYSTNDDMVSYGFYVESVTRNAGVLGVIVSEKVGGGFYYRRYDIEFDAGLIGGYNCNTGAPGFSGYIEGRKNLTSNTFAGLRIGYSYDGREPNNVPDITLQSGIEF